VSDPDKVAYVQCTVGPIIIAIYRDISKIKHIPKKSSSTLSRSIVLELHHNTMYIIQALLLIFVPRIIVSGFSAYTRHVQIPSSTFTLYRDISATTTTVLQLSNNSKPKGFINEFMSPFRKPDIPMEYVDKIMKAEASTTAAQDRQGRVILYTVIGLITFTLGAMNAFIGITSQATNQSPSYSSFLHLPWDENPILDFFLLNKIGGALSLILTGIGGTMIELEHRTKVENAEKIWMELQRRRRREEEDNGKQIQLNEGNTTSSKMSSSSSNPRSSNRSSNKKKKPNKKLSALAEVLVVETKQQSSKDESITPPMSSSSTPVLKNNKDMVVSTPSTDMSSQTKTKSDNFLNKMKDFYNQADQLAASQALLLNKELEDRGIIEKITDETGFKVIGKKNPSDQGSKN